RKTPHGTWRRCPSPLAGKLLRLAVAVGLAAIVLYYSHPSDILSAAAHARWTWLLAALALVLVDRTLMAMRWIDLLVALAPGSRPPAGAVLGVFVVRCLCVHARP